MVLRKSHIFVSGFDKETHGPGRFPVKINTKYAMKAKVSTLMDNGKVINHRGFVDAAKWIDERINFLLTIYKFDDYKVTVTGNVYRLVAWRNAGKPGTNGKAMSVTHVITVVE